MHLHLHYKFDGLSYLRPQWIKYAWLALLLGGQGGERGRCRGSPTNVLAVFDDHKILFFEINLLHVSCSLCLIYVVCSVHMTWSQCTQRIILFVNYSQINKVRTPDHLAGVSTWQSVQHLQMFEHQMYKSCCNLAWDTCTWDHVEMCLKTESKQNSFSVNAPPL